MTAQLFYPRVKQTVTTTGTAGVFDLTSGTAPTGFLSFAAVHAQLALSNYYVFYAMDDGTNFEIGSGVFNGAGATLTRDTVIVSSNANAAVNWGAGDKTLALINYASGAVAVDGASAAAFSVGSLPEAFGAQSLAIGTVSTAGTASGGAYTTGTDAVAIKGAASGTAAVAIANANANGDYSVAIGAGAGTNAVGAGAVAIGHGAFANKTDAVAIGTDANINGTGTQAVAIGLRASSFTQNGVALGTDALAFMSDSLAWGPGNADAGALGTGSTVLSLFLNKASGAGTAEVMKLPSTGVSPTFDETTSGYQAFAVLYGKLIGHNATDYKVFDIVVAMHRISGTVTLLGSPTITAGVASAGASGWTATAAISGTALDISIDAAASKWAGTLTMAWSNT